MMKKLLVFFAMLLPMVVYAYDVEIDGIYYNLITKAMQAEVTKGENRYSGEVKIPDTINVEGTAYSVAIIGSDAFSYNSSVTDIWIPKTISSIYSKAFMRTEGLQNVHITDLEAWCKISFGSSPLNYATHLYINDEELVDLTIPQSITIINYGTFMRLVNLKSVTFHDNVTKIGDSAFAGCINLESIKFPDSLTEIWDYAFSGCSKLSFPKLPQNIKKIGFCAFRGCNSLNSLNIPASLTDLNYAALIDCGNLVTIHVESDNPIYDSRNNCNAIIYTKSNQIFRACTSTNIPNDVESLGQYAFSGCTGLTDIKIPNNVKLIGAKAFDGCENLKSITIGKGVTNIEDWAFANCSNLMDFYIYSKEIPKTGSNYIFENSYIQYATLHVRESLIELFSSTHPWNVFKNIEKLDIPMRTLSYYVDGEEYKKYQIEEDETITPEPYPTKEGYTFSGWSEIPETMPANDVTITGSFSINKYKLTYKVDGEEYKRYDVDYGTAITPETEPIKEGYTFSGWSEIPETMPAKDVIITGSFAVNKYKLIYKVDGEEYKSYEVEYGAAIIAETAPTKEGYTFSGWSNIPATMPAKDVTVTGTFTVNKYKLVYKVDGEDYKSYDVEYGAAITAEPAPTKAGFEFSGWSTIPSTMPANNVTITGSFKATVKDEEGTIEVSGGEAVVTDGESATGDVDIPESVNVNGVSYPVTAILDGAYQNNANITSATIPESVTTIGANAFNGCSNLENVNVGKSVTNIGSKAFANLSASAAVRRANTRGASGLVIKCYAINVPTTAADAFENTPIGSATLLVDDNSVAAYRSASPWSGFGTIMGFSEATGIDGVLFDNSNRAKVFSIDGKPLSTPQKGINIIRMDNGKTKKVVVK